ncbi:hypothetical protein ACMZ5E_23340 [Streptomyces rhizosphaericola]|uniref:hypothetical protein n=1 Tax=Streptomyces rhizosphaericola TaxID=2564098 RepID=UPI0039EEC56A
MPAIEAVADAASAADHRRLIERIEHATPGAPRNGKVAVHLRHAGLGGDEIRYALEDEGWKVSPIRSSGGTPAALLVTER